MITLSVAWQRLGNTFPRQRIRKQMLEAVFSMLSVPKLYSEHEGSVGYR
jgi:hypothetical protein